MLYFAIEEYYIEFKNQSVKVIDTNVSILIKIYYFVPNICTGIGHWRTTSLKNCHLVCVPYHFCFHHLIFAGRHQLSDRVRNIGDCL